MYLIYIDESGNTGCNLTDSQQPILVLGALLIHQDQWRGFEKAINTHVKHFFGDTNSDDFEIHASEIRGGKGFFEGYSIDQRLTFSNECMKLASSHNAKFIYRAIEKQRYQKWHNHVFGAGVQINPYIPGFLLLTQTINTYLRSLPGSPNGILVSDENKEIAKDIEKSTRLLRSISGPLQLSQIIEKNFFISSHESVPLQICDVCTLWARRIEEARLANRELNHMESQSKAYLDPLLVQGQQNFDVVEWLVEQQKQKKRPGE